MSGVSPAKAGAVLALLERAADADERCPGNAEIGRTTDLAMEAVSRTISQLETDGLIAVERRGPGRMVTILASGRSTKAMRPGHQGNQRVVELRRAAAAEAEENGRRRAEASREGATVNGRLGKAPTLAEQIEAEALEFAKRRKIARSTGTVKRIGELGAAPADDAHLAGPIASREPCFRCGARGGFDCGHRRVAA